MSHSYDNANRVTHISRGRAAVFFGYDTGIRRTWLTLSKNIVMGYRGVYGELRGENSSELTWITYRNGSTVRRKR